MTSIKQVIDHIEEWKKDYTYNSKTNEFDFNKGHYPLINVKNWFDLN